MRGAMCLDGGNRASTTARGQLCFLAGANSIFYGDKLLTTGNPDVQRDRALMDKLGISAQSGTAD
jgi:biotin synthase